jgi:hypothetical protein
MTTNAPEKPHFDRIMAVEKEIADQKEDLKALWQSAKDALGGDELKILKAAVKRALADPDKLIAQRELEDKADDLRKALGDLAGSPLGDAAVRAA